MKENTPPLRSPPSPLHRAGLLAVAVAAAIVIILALVVGLPVARALGDSLSDVIRDNGDVISLFLLVSAGLLVVAGLRYAFATSRKASALAEQAAIVQLQTGQPVRLVDVGRLVESGLAERATTLHYQAVIADAQRQFPALTSYHQSVRVDAAPAQPAPVLPPSVVEPPPGLEEAIRRGFSTPDRWYLGTDEAGQPQQITLKYAGFIAESGLQGTGKTNLAVLLTGQCAAHNGTLFVADPHLGDPESLSAQIEPFSGAVERFGVTRQEINGLITKVNRIYQRRCADPRQATHPVLLVIDEFMDLMVRQEIEPPQLQALLALSGTGRKKKVYVVLISQNWSQRMLGPLGVAIRQCVTHSLVCRSGEETAKFLLPTSFAPQASMLRLGQSLYFGPGGEPVITQTPQIKPAELHVAARGLQPRPYAPWSLAALPMQPAPLAAAPIPPTIPLSVQPAPPTQRLLLSVPEQIVELLRGSQGWMTATEIADALGVDLQVVRTELTEVYRKRLVQRQRTARSPTERYEYANQRINESTNQRLASTA